MFEKRVKNECYVVLNMKGINVFCFILGFFSGRDEDKGLFLGSLFVK